MDSLHLESLNAAWGVAQDILTRRMMLSAAVHVLAAGTHLRHHVAVMSAVVKNLCNTCHSSSWSAKDVYHPGPALLHIHTLRRYARNPEHVHRERPCTAVHTRQTPALHKASEGPIRTYVHATLSANPPPLVNASAHQKLW
jgi:hypothetical protein